MPKRRILVVDDEPFVCDAIRMMLRFDGHDVECVCSGEEALDRLNKTRFDLVFTDFSMPKMRGDELAITIKKRDPKMPVIMVTAYAEMLHPPIQGVDCLISKPFLLENLRKAIRSCSVPEPDQTR